MVELRTRKKAVLRNTLVRNAMKLFLDRGYDAISVDEIVAASMCSRSTFHRYFGTKEDLLFPTAGDRLHALEAGLRAAVGRDPWTVVRSEASAALCGFLDDFEPDLRTQCIGLWFSEPTPRRRYLEIVMEWERVLAEFLAVHLEQPGSSSLEVQLLASSISSVLRAALNVAMQTGEDVHELIQRAFDLLESGRIAGLLIRRPARRGSSSPPA